MTQKPKRYDEKLITVPITETEKQRKEREKRGEPLPVFSYTAVVEVEEKQ